MRYYTYLSIAEQNKKNKNKNFIRKGININVFSLWEKETRLAIDIDHRGNGYLSHYCVTNGNRKLLTFRSPCFLDWKKK